MQEKITRMWNEALAAYNTIPFTPVLTHFDLHSAHVLFDPATGNLTGVIDWGDAAISDPAWDFQEPLLSYGEPFVEKVLRSYGQADNGLWRRITFYCITAKIHSVLRALDKNDKAHMHQELESLRKDLANFI